MDGFGLDGEVTEPSPLPEATPGQIGLLQILCAVPSGQFEWVSQ